MTAFASDARPVFERIGLARAIDPVDIDAALRDVVLDASLIEDFRPLTSCLEWELCQRVWERDGPRLFVRHDVPNLVNNSGRASGDAAALFLAQCRDLDADGPLHVLELGAGLGLFALLFLDGVRDQCRDEGRDEYDRLVYHVSDGTPAMVQHWADVGIFDRHPGKVRPTVVDARRPSTVPRAGVKPRAVFLNYILDELPATVIRPRTEGPEELRVRTHLRERRGKLGLADDGWTAAKVREHIARDDLGPIEPLVDRLDFEAKYRPIGPDDRVPRLAEALAFGQGMDRVLLNHGALDCLEDCLEMLADGGYVLVNDYGPDAPEETGDFAMSQRFGPVAAVGLNFPLIDWHVRCLGWESIRPDPRSNRRIQTRLVCRDPARLPRTRETFAARYQKEGAEAVDGPAEQARAHALAGRREEALTSFRLALRRNPHDWQLLGQAASYVGLTLRDHDAGVKLARAALEMNPWTSPWLWNILGDSLYCLDRLAEAHEAFLQARRIDPDDVRTLFNLSYTLPLDGRHAEAVELLARALVRDEDKLYRDRLLDRQRLVLEQLDERREEQAERDRRRTRAFFS